MKRLWCGCWFGILVLAHACLGATFEVGPGRQYADPNAVPWESLSSGDTVLIHWRNTAYTSKWVLCRQGTQDAPIIVRGVPGPAGQLPVLDGHQATTRAVLNYWNQPRGVIKIGGANIPADTTPRHITIENLEIRGARPPNHFQAANGTLSSYPNNAAAIYVEKGEHITIRNCTFHDNGNGLFVAAQARNVLVEGNYIYDNGNDGSLYEHNSYTAAIGITFRYNRYGPLRAGCLGNNLKDRSAGLTVCHNWIEGGNRQLDLVDAEDDPVLQADPRYRKTYVYGNVLIEPPAAGNRQIVHYGGDSGDTSIYRKGVLYFYNNTIVSTRTDRTTLFRLSTNEEQCDARNNIFYVSAAGNTLSLLDDTGVLRLAHNWFKPGWVQSFGGNAGTVAIDGPNLSGSAPGFLNEMDQNFRLARGSVCVNAGTNIHPSVLPEHDLTREYERHQNSEQRRMDGQLDLGAYEFSPLHAWRFEKFGSGYTHDPAAYLSSDPDQDEVANLVEYALGTSPTQPNEGAALRAFLAPDGTERNLALSFPFSAPGELVYSVQMSTNLLTWDEGAIWSDATPASSGGLATIVQDGSNMVVRANAPIQGHPRLFMRLQVQATR